MTINDLDAFFAKCKQIIYEEMRNALSKLGEECVKRVRERGAEESWIDRTGNLRSSIGYAVYESGRAVIQSNFYVVKDGSLGQSTGQQMIDELASLYANTMALVVVAAMEYADEVEALSNKDVLASTELWAKGVVEEYLELGMQRAAKRIDSL